MDPVTLLMVVAFVGGLVGFVLLALAIAVYIPSIGARRSRLILERFSLV